MAEPFCDFVQVTVPADGWRDVHDAVRPVLDSVGLQVEHADDMGNALWRAAGEGTVKSKRYGAVVALGASGAVLAGLRLAGLLGTYLAELAARPHRVTRLDLTLDVVEDTAPVIERLVDGVASPEGLALSRKRLLAKHCTRLVHRRADGRDTGTVYLGSAQADVRMCVYDKREERLARDLPDIGPLTRYELRLREGTGITLRDAAVPSAAFWHYVSPAVLPRPVGVPEWGAHGSGFELERADVPLPAQRLIRRVQASADLPALLRLADECGPFGRAMLFAEIGKLAPAGGGDRSTRAVDVSAPLLVGLPPAPPPAPALPH